MLFHTALMMSRCFLTPLFCQMPRQAFTLTGAMPRALDAAVDAAAAAIMRVYVMLFFLTL